MKITLEIPDTVICAFINGVEVKNTGLRLFSCQLGGNDLKDGNVVKLVMEEEE